MYRGRKPTPTALKIVRGNPGKRALPKEEPQPPKRKATPPPPAHLREDARAIWTNETAPFLFEAGLLTTADELALAMDICECEARRREAAKAIPVGGLLIRVNGQLIPNPMIKLEDHYAQRVRRGMVAFGMTPSDRTRVAKTSDDGDHDPADAY